MLARLRVVAAAAMAAGLALAVAAEKPGTLNVVIDGLKYAPAALDVRVGDTIVWKNNDAFAHTVTARGGKFDSGEIPAGGSWSYRATSTGSVEYYCKLHPTMQATLEVR